MAASAPVRLRIESVAAGGEGIGRTAEGVAVFVHRTTPGDIVEASLTEHRGRWARARLLRVLEASPQRREPPCPFQGECGGCTLEHLTYPAQLAAKGRIVADALTRIGGTPTEPVEVVASPVEHRYRNRVSFALQRRGRGHVVAGFHALGEPERIVEIDGRCLLPEEPIARAWDALRAGWGPDSSRLPSGAALRLTLRASEAGAVSLLIEGGFSPGRPAELMEAVPGLASIWHRPGRVAAELIAGAPGLPEQWGGEEVDLSGAAFLQVNRAAAALLERHVLEQAGDVRGLRVIDAYCGIGLHARRLARAGATVVGIELDPHAVAAARAAAPDGTELHEGAVEALLPAHLPADLVILNPPRAGIDAAVADALVAVPARRIIYISCDPATLARDLRRMAPAYRLAGVRAFDLFPQTAHVETVAVLAPLDGR